MILPEAYASDDVQVDVAATLLNRLGQRLADLPVSMHEPILSAPVIDLPLTALAPGEYLIQIVATSEG